MISMVSNQDSYGYSNNYNYNYNYRNNSSVQQKGNYEASNTSSYQQKFSIKSVDWSRIRLVSFQKDNYREHPDITNMSLSDMNKIREENEISIVSGDDIPKPIRNFHEAGFTDEILSIIRHAGYNKPSPVQLQGWPIALKGRDMIAIAETGSGKTLGFLLPGIIHISAQRRSGMKQGPILLVLAPTRELADQIKTECIRFSSKSSIRTGVAYGGVPKRPQIITIQQGVDIMIACPGRLLDFIQVRQDI